MLFKFPPFLLKVAFGLGSKVINFSRVGVVHSGKAAKLEPQSRALM